MPGVWAKLRRFLGLAPQRTSDLTSCRQQLSQCDLELEGVRKKLIQRAESLERLAQRYDEQADKHNKLKHRDLAEAAVRQKLKVQMELKQWQQRVEEWTRRLKVLKARQARLEERDRHLRIDELSDYQEPIERAREEIHQIHRQLEFPMELEDGEVSTFQ